MSVTAQAIINAKYASSSDNTEFVSPGYTIIDKFTATNTDSVARTVSINLVVLNDVANAANLIVKDISLAAGATYEFTEVKNHILNLQDFISVKASVASKVVIRASGRVVSI